MRACIFIYIGTTIEGVHCERDSSQGKQDEVEQNSLVGAYQFMPISSTSRQLGFEIKAFELENSMTSTEFSLLTVVTLQMGVPLGTLTPKGSQKLLCLTVQAHIVQSNDLFTAHDSRLLLLQGSKLEWAGLVRGGMNWLTVHWSR